MSVYSKFLELVGGVSRTIDLSTNTLSASGIQFNGSTSGHITQNAADVTTNYAIKWPAAQAASAGYVLANDGSGNLSWVSAAAGSALDGTFRIENSADNTKMIAFDASAIAHLTTRTISMPNADVDLGALTNSNISTSAAIVYSKLDLSGSIVNSDISSSASIAYSKLALTGDIVNADIATGAAIAYSKLSLATSIVNGDISGSAAIAYSKLALTSSIVNADIATGAAIAYSKLSLASSIVNADIATGAAIALSKLAALSTHNRVLVSDSSGVISESSVSSTTLGYLDATSSIQTQLNSMAPSANVILKDGSVAFTGDQSMGGHKLTNVATPTSVNDATNKAYVDTLVVTGGRVKEAVLTSVQFSNTQGILPASIIDISANPVAGDTIVITNGTTTETWTFQVAARTAPFEVQIGVDHPATMANLAAAIAADSVGEGGDYDAVLMVLDEDGEVVVFDKSTSVLPSVTRIYGVWATQANCTVFSFHGLVEYSTNSVITTQLPSVDPVTSQFGFGRNHASLIDGEIHITLDTNVQMAWNASLNSWVTLSGSSSIPDATSANGGGVKGKVTADALFGLEINSGVLEINIASSQGLKFSGAGALETDYDNSTIGIVSGHLGVLAGGIANNQISGSAAIAYSKLSLSGSIVNADISGSAAIAYSKLSLSGSIVNADVASGAAIAYSKLNLTSSVRVADLNSQASTSTQFLAANGSGGAAFRAIGSGDLPSITVSNLGTITDGITLDQSGAGSTLEVKSSGIGATQLATGAFDGTTISGGGGTAASVLSAPAVKEAVVAGEAFAATTLFAVRFAKAADAGYVAGRVYKADNDASSVDNFWAIGLVYAPGSVSAGSVIEATKVGLISVPSHGFTVGAPVFLSASGAVTGTAPTTSNLAIVKVGVVRDANNIEVQVQAMGVN